MPVQTQILTRRGTAASWTSTNPTLGAGEIGYETDTGRFKIGTGAAAWASLGYFNRDPLTTKGDLYTFSTTDDRLAVGANGESLVADSSTSTGLRYQSNFAAGKNFLINSNFANWQRGTTLTYTSSGLNYLPDRFFSWTIGTLNVTVSQQTFAPGTAPVAGYEGQYFMRNAVNSISGQSIQAVGQRIEDVRTLAGQTATFSFWAKADASRTYTTRFIQNFGSGGSSEVAVSGGSHSVTTSWQRFSVTVSIPSISGKTIGTSSYLQPLLDGPANTANTLDTWGWQLEAGSVATAFQTATGTIQGELAACQRYYWRQTADATAVYAVLGNGSAASTTTVNLQILNPVSMRVAPSSLDYANIGADDGVSLLSITSAAIFTNLSNAKAVNIVATVTGATQFRPYRLLSNNSSSGYVGLSAEL